VRRYRNDGDTVNILAIESSCDETAVAVVRDGRSLLSDCISSQVDIHKLYGGVVPEIASRKHIETIYPLAEQALTEAGITRADIDAVAVTYAPGLIGAVLVGVNFAKAAAFALGKPLVPVHHIRGHIAANYLSHPELEPPFLCLVVSGGHTMLVDVRDYTDMQILGGTRDDAAGECFDKIARVLGMPYPGGAALDRMSQGADGTKYPLPRAKVDGNPLDLSFSGLKTAAINLIHNAQQKHGAEALKNGCVDREDPSSGASRHLPPRGKALEEAIDVPALCAAVAGAVSNALVSRTELALEQTGRGTLAVAGGVAANSRIRADVTALAERLGVRLCLPELRFCGDNAAMIGAQGYYEYLAGRTADMTLNAYATKSLVGETV
jgi:N6-L-threonylcarbamoyladenine synthase